MVPKGLFFSLWAGSNDDPEGGGDEREVKEARPRNEKESVRYV